MAILPSRTVMAGLAGQLSSTASVIRAKMLEKEPRNGRQRVGPAHAYDQLALRPWLIELQRARAGQPVQVRVARRQDADTHAYLHHLAQRVIRRHFDLRAQRLSHPVRLREHLEAQMCARAKHHVLMVERFRECDMPAIRQRMTGWDEHL